jgi:hypothetical protein
MPFEEIEVLRKIERRGSLAAHIFKIVPGMGSGQVHGPAVGVGEISAVLRVFS